MPLESITQSINQYVKKSFPHGIHIIYQSSSLSSSSSRAISTDIPDRLSPPLSIVNRFRQVLRTIYAELLYEGSSWSPCLWSAMCGVHKNTSLTSSSLLLQQCPACLVRLTWIVFVGVVGGCTAVALWGVASRACSILLAAFLCSCRQAFSPYV